MLVREGLVEVEVPDVPETKGPGKKMPGFYNGSQKINRDISVAFLNTVKPNLSLDAFGGTGIRGIRFREEAGVPTVISETNPASAEIIRKNIERNGNRTTLIQADCESVMRDFLFGFIDVDPYGSALPYIDSALRNVRNGGYVGITATDLSALTGSAEKATARRYRARVGVDSLKHEKGVRLLIRAVIEHGAAFDIAPVPLISFWHSHFYRVIFQVNHGATRCDELLSNIDAVDVDGNVEGPLWTGKIESEAILSTLKVPDQIAEDRNTSELLAYLKSEDTSIFFTDLNEAARKIGMDPPRISTVIDRLREKGFTAVRTHFFPTGIKCSPKCPDQEIENAIRGN